MADDRIEITLEDEAIVEFVRSKVRSGEYASEADVVREVLLMFQEEQAEVDRWVKEVILPRLDAAEADPSSLIPIEQVEANLAEGRGDGAAGHDTVSGERGTGRDSGRLLCGAPDRIWAGRLDGGGLLFEGCC
jgi:Arc/MetJ-type ribon-helix-helix transcriptional regulator